MKKPKQSKSLPNRLTEKNLKYNQALKSSTVFQLKLGRKLSNFEQVWQKKNLPFYKTHCKVQIVQLEIQRVEKVSFEQSSN